MNSSDSLALLNAKREYVRLKPWFYATDIFFIAYWVATALHLIPPEFAYHDYKNPVMVAWNWSFLPLDMLISASGLTSLWLFANNRAGWRELSLLSLAFTVTSGLNAIAFWAFIGDFDPTWWIPNLYLVVYPLYFIARLIRAS